MNKLIPFSKCLKWLSLNPAYPVMVQLSVWKPLRVWRTSHGILFWYSVCYEDLPHDCYLKDYTSYSYVLYFASRFSHGYKNFFIHMPSGSVVAFLYISRFSKHSKKCLVWCKLRCKCLFKNINLAVTLKTVHLLMSPLPFIISLFV